MSDEDLPTGAAEVIKFLRSQPTLEDLDAFLADLTPEEVALLEAIELRIRLNEPVEELTELGPDYADMLAERIRRQVEDREGGHGH